MNIFEQIKDTLAPLSQDIFSTAEIKKFVSMKHRSNPYSIIPSDYCYNRINNGIMFDKHIFIWLSRGKYKFVGENYHYTGDVYHKPIGETVEKIIGNWTNGVYKPK